jgi:hypothetical protein
MFNWKIYRELNKDLINAGLNTREQIINHWRRYGYRENRKTKITDLYPDFNLENYKQANPTLKFNTNEEYELHYILKQQRQKEIRVAIVAIFKNEAHILEEWIQHYLKEGIDTFLLIDNDSNDNYMNILKKYIDSNKVVLNINKQRHTQAAHYNNYYLKTVKDNYDWVLVVDFDEFVYARNGFKTIKEYLKSLNENIAQVYIPWKLYGSNGLIKQPESVIRNFIRRQVHNIKVKAETKTIVRCNKLKELSLHSSKITDGIEINATNNIYSNIYKNRASDTTSEDILKRSYLHLNHYRIQSWEWFKKVKMTRGSAFNIKADNMRNERYFKMLDHNDIIDNELANKKYN